MTRKIQKNFTGRAKTKDMWFVYLLECADGRLYTGITTDLARRFQQHVSGKGAKFTAANKPTRMLASKPCKNRSEASKLEAAMKKLKPLQKRAVAAKW